MDSSHDEANNEQPKTPLENLQDILAKADERAAAKLPPGAKAIFTIEGEEPEVARLHVSKTLLRSVLAAVQQFPQERLSRQRLEDLLAGFNEPHSVERIYSENIRKLDEMIKSFQNSTIAIKKNLV